MIALTLKLPLKWHAAVVLVAIYSGLLLWFVPHYFNWTAEMICGLMLVPYICTMDAQRRSLRYLAPALLFITLAMLMPVNTLFFLAMLFAALLLIESSFGRVSNILLFLLLLISPVFRHFTRLWEFPMRLWLTEKVAAVVNLLGMQASAVGNQIQLGKYEFSIDTACAGLNMLVMSVIIGLFVLAWYQKHVGKFLSVLSILLYVGFAVALNVLGNFFRILFIVIFKIMPGTFFHDVIGIICLAVYVLLPLLVLTKPILIRLGNGRSAVGAAIEPALHYPWLHALLLAAIMFTAVRVTSADSFVKPAANFTINGYSQQQMDGGIMKFENRRTLIYCKPAAFYAPEHDPMICWVGSGYTFTNIRQEMVGNTRIYLATLQKGTDRLYSAWWFDNGSIKTVDQFAWRWTAAKSGSRFYLVNVSASSPQALRERVGELLSKNLFKTSTTIK
ncbi:exosortase N [Mucilaginibacter terrenus]|uniref:Exosortase N n=1 Tax=Mucilaginibacter terrenus TaxID=2482727 RepID=A0A3E2NXM2_9SPHI|nr:exosortase N [Mucilaginibacter terrenus]RFZ85743.1 exosortase N [Mucilaginibacter terrenus]